jgi:predicted hydrocarbon binding protein
MFTEERDELKFDWNMIGNIGEGRPNLGNTMDVSVYRLMQFTLRDVLIKKFNAESADKIFYEAGKHAGKQFCKELITERDDFNKFVVELQKLFKKLKMNILRIEKADLEKMAFTLTLAEDLDCSGLPASDETICTYDEGFLSGLLSEYTGKNFSAKEVDCWCSGDRVCRFEAKSAG